MPILLLKFNILAFIKLIVSIITAELDWIIDVEIKPTIKLFFVEDVKVNNLFFTLVIEIDIRLLLKVSIEYIKRIIPPSKRGNDILSPLKYIENSNKI